MKPIISILVCFLLVSLVRGQVLVRFNPSMQGSTVQGLALAQVLNNTTTEFSGYVDIRVAFIGGRMIFTLRTGTQIFRTGVNNIDPNAFAQGRVQYGNHESANMVRQTGRFPEGELEYCFEVVVSESKDPNLVSFENCFTHFNQPFTPLLLNNPVDGEETCSLRPNFFWQPPVPIPPGAQFRLTLAEVELRQDPVQAISYNTPIILQQQIMGNTLVYPSILPDLRKDRTYAWQVIMYANTTALLKSEVWTFQTKCEEESKEPDPNGYRELKEGSTGEFLMAPGYLRFAIRNPYGSGPLSYQIVSMNHQETPIKGLPRLVMRNGMNQYSVNLDNGKFKLGDEYLLTVILKNGRKSYLRFIYVEH